MAFDAFLKLDGIKGESQDFKHKGEIDILSFRLGVSQKGTHATGGGGGAGKAAMKDMLLVKQVDASSPLLILNCLAGTHIKEGNFVLRKAGGHQLEYYKVKLTDVLISSVSPHGKAEQEVTAPQTVGVIRDYAPPTVTVKPGDEIPLEDVSLNFSAIEFAYQRQNAQGKADGGPLIVGFDVKGNQKV